MQEHGTLMSGAAIITHTHTHETLLGGSAAKDTPHDMGPHTYTHIHKHKHTTPWLPPVLELSFCPKDTEQVTRLCN